MKDKKVLLIIPPRNILKSSVKRCCTPIGLAYIAAVLEKEKINVQILDAYAEGYDTEIEIEDEYLTVGLTDEQIKTKIKEYNPEFVGVTCGFTSEIINTYRICKLTKEVNPDIKVVVGGLHPSNYPFKTLDGCKEIDYIILGEGEYRMPKLVKGDENFEGLVIAKNRKINPIKEKIENLDE